MSLYDAASCVRKAATHYPPAIMQSQAFAETDTDSFVVQKVEQPPINLPHNFLTSIDSSFPFPTNYGKNYKAQIDINYKPSLIKSIGGVYLLIGGPGRAAEVYSQSTLRRKTVLSLDGKLISTAFSS